MKDTTVAIRMEEGLWKKFKRFSLEQGMSASALLRTFMETQLKRRDREAGISALLEMGSRPEEGRGPVDLSSRADGYLYGRGARTRGRRNGRREAK